MKAYVVAAFSVLLLWGCGNASGAGTLEETIISVPSETALDAELDDVSFGDVLQQYQDLNARLSRVTYQLQKANAALCPITRRDAGFTVHMVTDYPENLQPIARELLSVSNRLSVRTVRPGSHAAQSGLRPGDEIAQIFGTFVPSGATAKILYDAASKRAFEGEESALKIRRDGQILDILLKPETLCGYPVNVFFSERINGHTDGREVWITSELMRSEPDDLNLALVVAHEMAHAIAGHVNQSPSRDLELKADQMALIMLARAGYDIDKAADFWQLAPHPHSDGYEMSSRSTHPSKTARHENFIKTRMLIDAMTQENRPLVFEGQ